MNFDHNDKTKELIARVEKFMDDYVYPNEKVYEEQMAAFGIIDGKFLKYLKI